MLIKLFISSLGPSQALLLSRQATMGQGGLQPGPTPGTHTRSSFQAAVSPSWQATRGAYGGSGGLHGAPSLNLGATAGHGPGFLRHAMTTLGPALGHLPEQLAAVSGPLMGPSVHVASHAGAADRGTARRSGLWGYGATGSGGLTHHSERHAASVDVTRANSGTAGVMPPSAAAAAAGASLRGSSGYGGRQALASEVASPRGSSFTGSSGLVSLGSGHIGHLLQQQQAWQLLTQQQLGGYAGGYTAAQLARARVLQRPAGALSGLTRSNSL